MISRMNVVVMGAVIALGSSLLNAAAIVNTSRQNAPGVDSRITGAAVPSASAVGYGWTVDRAIDGDTGTGYHSPEDAVAHWWRVDLGSVQDIGAIQLVNRGGYEGRLTNFKVTVYGNDGTTEAWSQSFATGAGQYVGLEGWMLPSVQGRYVEVEQLAANTTPLTLMEVGVFGGTKNVALGKATNTSSQTVDPGRAVDGNNAQNWSSGTISHTAPGGSTPVFWEVLLGGQHSIEEIVLYNRGEGLNDRLSNFRVSIFDGGTEVYGENFFTDGSTNPGRIFGLTGSDVEQIGDRVRVELLGTNNNGDDILSLSEVEVIGTVIPEPATLALLACSGVGVILQRRRRRAV